MLVTDFAWLSWVWLSLAPDRFERLLDAPAGRSQTRGIALRREGKIMEYNVLILRCGDRLTANPGECGEIEGSGCNPRTAPTGWIAAQLSGALERSAAVRRENAYARGRGTRRK